MPFCCWVLLVYTTHDKEFSAILVPFTSKELKDKDWDLFFSSSLQYISTSQLPLAGCLNSLRHAHKALIMALELKSYTTHTDWVARICSCGSADSRSFCTIFRKLSTNRLSVCAWHATSSWSMASIAITTNLKHKNCLLNKYNFHIIFIISMTLNSTCGNIRVTWLCIFTWTSLRWRGKGHVAWEIRDV